MKKILIISHFIAPLASIASVRWSKLSKYLKQQHGDHISISILTDKKCFSDLRKHQQFDETLLKDLKYFNEIYEIPQPKFTSFLYELRRRKKQKAEFVASQVVPSFTKKLFIEIRGLFLQRVAKKIVQKIPIRDYDVIISSCGPLWTHGVASYIKKTNPKVKWIADYRDMSVDERDSFIIRYWNTYQSRTYTKNADLIIKIQGDLITDACPKIPEEIITNGYDPEEMLPPQKPTKFSLVFTGSLGHAVNTDFSVIFEAINDIIIQYKLVRSDFCVIYAGVAGDTAEQFAKKGNGEDLFINKHFLPRSEAILLQRSSAILLQSGITTKRLRSFWTGKMYEYMTAKKPIVYIMNGRVHDNLPSKHIDKLGGYCYEACNHEQSYVGLKKYIYTKYLEWKQTGNVSVHQDIEYINSFSYENIAKKLWNIIERI